MTRESYILQEDAAAWMTHTLARLAWAGALVATLAGCTAAGGEPPELLVFAAASLVGALDEIEEELESSGEVRVAISYGASQMLAQQIASGAPADLLISAGEFPVSFLRDRGLVESAPILVLTNELVVAVRSNTGPRLTSMEDLATANVRRIAVADAGLAPAGRYAKESLASLGLWDAIGPKLVNGPDVRATLAYVESGSADAALVYRTDAEASDRVEIMDIVPGDSYPPVIYPAVVLSASNHGAEAQDFLRFLVGEEAREIFRRFGFVPFGSQ